MKKRIMSLAVVIAIFIGAFGSSVFAEDTGVQMELSQAGEIPTLSAAHSIFKDVDTNDWFYNYVVYAYGVGLVNGTDDNTFEPQAKMTRAMLATILYRIYQGWDLVNPAYVGSSYFTDLDETAYYYDAVTWCYNVGIVDGTGEHSFSPNDSITREQVAAMIGRRIDPTGVDIPATNYVDGADISDWAKEHVDVLTYCEIMDGYTDGTFLPKNNVSRAEATKMVSIFHLLFSEQHV